MTSSSPSCSRRARWSRTRTCSATRSRSPGCPSTRPGSSAPCWPGWPGRTPPRRRCASTSRCNAGRPGSMRAGLTRAGEGRKTDMSETDVQAGQATTQATDEDVLEALRDVVDPELGVNVVDLGLVYGVTLAGDGVATIDMTLTSAACPHTDVIEDQAASALEGLVPDFRINWVWLPPWGPDKITEDGREQLRALGFNV